MNTTNNEHVQAYTASNMHLCGKRAVAALR
jgi:hypothetical protein